MTKKRTYKAWTEYEDKTLADLRRKNVSIRHIAEILGRTMPSVTNRIVILKGKNKEAPPEAVKKHWVRKLLGLK
jgi:IS30 family transposase